MMRRSLRALVLLLTVAVTAGVVWRATANEQARGRMRLASQYTDAVAADAIFELSDLRATLHAYVAPGQGYEFWSRRAETQIASLRTRLQELTPASAAANHPLDTAAANLDALAAAERRVRAAVREAQPLLAGDIIFTETRDLIDGAARDLSDARQAMARASSAREAGSANEQSLLAGALIAVWIFALILLTPVPAPSKAAPTAAPTSGAESLGLGLRDLTPAVPLPQTEPAGSAPAEVVDPAPLHPAPLHPAPLHPGTPAPVHPCTPAPDLRELADLCADIGRVADATELEPLLERMASLIGARGMVVWLVSPEGERLEPAMAHGYDQKVLSRMGSIAVDDHNITAAAFRTQQVTQSAPEHDQPGAIAVPMVSASGTSGVLAAEIPDGIDLDRAAATGVVLAAQLASLFPGSPQATELRGLR